MDTRKLSALLSMGSLCGVPAAWGQTAPCALLTQDRVRAVVGAKVGAGTAIATTGCSWTAAGPPKVTVTVSMQSEKMFDAAKSSSPPKTTKTAVSGVGDEAIFTGVNNFASLWVRKGAKCLLVRIYGLPVSDAQAKLKPLAADAVTKL